jgi:hypothetical protein
VRYLGPLIVIFKNKRGTYIISELNGSVLDCPVATFCVIPYFARSSLDLPSLDELIDISRTHLTQLEDSEAADPEVEDEGVDVENLLEDD